MPFQGQPPNGLTSDVGEVDVISVRKLHKADREKLRRNRINEQFAELASVLGTIVCISSVRSNVLTMQFFNGSLDPERPKNDKATILGDGVLALNEVRETVRKLKLEHEALVEEQKEVNSHLVSCSIAVLIYKGFG